MFINGFTKPPPDSRILYLSFLARGWRSCFGFPMPQKLLIFPNHSNPTKNPSIQNGATFNSCCLMEPIKTERTELETDRLWSTEDCAYYFGKCSVRHFSERIRTLPDFPKEIRLPTPKGGWGHPLFRPEDVIRFAKRFMHPNN